MKSLYDKFKSYTVGDAFTTAKFNSILQSYEPKLNFLMENYLSSLSRPYDTTPYFYCFNPSAVENDLIYIEREATAVEIYTTNADVATSIDMVFGPRDLSPVGFSSAQKNSISIIKLVDGSSNTGYLILQPKLSTAGGNQPGDRFSKDVYIELIAAAGPGTDLVSLSVSSNEEGSFIYDSNTLTYNKKLTITVDTNHASIGTLTLSTLATTVSALIDSSGYRNTSDYLVSYSGSDVTINQVSGGSFTKTAVFQQAPLHIAISNNAITELKSKLYTLFTGVGSENVVFLKLTPNTTSSGKMSHLGKESYFSLTSTSDIITSEDFSTEVTAEGDETVLVPFAFRFGSTVRFIDNTIHNISALGSVGDKLELNGMSTHDHTRLYLNSANSIDISNAASHEFKSNDIKYLEADYSGTMSVTLGSTTTIGVDELNLKVYNGVSGDHGLRIFKSSGNLYSAILDVNNAVGIFGDIVTVTGSTSAGFGTNTPTVTIGSTALANTITIGTSGQTTSTTINGDSVSIASSQTLLTLGDSCTTVTLGDFSTNVNIGNDAGTIYIGEASGPTGTTIHIGDNDQGGDIMIGSNTNLSNIGVGAYSSAAITPGSTSSIATTQVTYLAGNDLRLDGDILHVTTETPEGGTYVYRLKWVKITSGVVQSNYAGGAAGDGYILAYTT